MSLNQEPSRLSQEGALSASMKAAKETGLQQDRLDSIEKRLKQSLADPTPPRGMAKGPLLLGAAVVLFGGALLYWEEDSSPARPASKQVDVSVSDDVELPTLKVPTSKPAPKQIHPKSPVKPGVVSDARPTQEPRQSDTIPKDTVTNDSVKGGSALTGEGTLSIELGMMESARAAFEAKEWKRANQLLGKLVRLYPQSALYVEAIRLRAMTLSKLGQNAMAELLLQKLLRSHTKAAKRGELLLLLGVERINMGDCPGALRSLNQALEAGLSSAEEKRVRQAIQKCRPDTK